VVYGQSGHLSLDGSNFSENSAAERACTGFVSSLVQFNFEYCAIESNEGKNCLFFEKFFGV
jgi:hypothetical protein